ncbi:16S rRNA (guanine(966)-N(2))-methyltransferase RsmD [Demequina sp.]|uniref:16S rRNA (guanine(966)-N(2))-methyltransferase RsmD n=1 Tax=Demequina sp. TaxID=2050685 RepID=UPI003D0B7301
MTRIIAGDFGGRRLQVPAAGTRPTTDRVREALFSRLDAANALKGAHVLDLYAGSGALGLEAMSRKAATATLVESATPAARIIEANIRELGLGTRARVVKERALQFLRRTNETYSLVFIDPPYDIARGDLAAVLDALADRLDPEANVIVEWTRRAPLPEWPPTIAPIVSKDYGETVLHFAHKVKS